MTETNLKALEHRKHFARWQSLMVNDLLLEFYERYEEWLKHTKQPYFFFVIDPSTTHFTIQRWGYSKKPFYVNDAYFWRVHCPDFKTMTKNAQIEIEKMVEVYGRNNVNFKQTECEWPPKAKRNEMTYENKTKMSNAFFSQFHSQTPTQHLTA